MKDMHAQLETLLTEASECALIASLATDKMKRDLFARLANHYAVLATEVKRKGYRGSDSPKRVSGASAWLPAGRRSRTSRSRAKSCGRTWTRASPASRPSRRVHRNRLRPGPSTTRIPCRSTSAFSATSDRGLLTEDSYRTPGRQLPGFCFVLRGRREHCPTKGEQPSLMRSRWRQSARHGDTTSQPRQSDGLIAAAAVSRDRQAAPGRLKGTAVSPTSFGCFANILQ